MSEDYTSFWEQGAMAQELSNSEKELRDKFVDEYLLDFSQTAAAIRIGFGAGFAQTYAEKFMAEPYVRKRIMDLQTAMAGDEKTEADLDRRRIRAALMREAHYRGPGSSHAARVSALAKLAAIRDMDSPTRLKIDAGNRGGVMMVPAIASIEEWEQAAQASQGALQAESNL